jgi:hypothetical protein
MSAETPLTGPEVAEACEALLERLHHESSAESTRPSLPTTHEEQRATVWKRLELLTVELREARGTSRESPPLSARPERPRLTLIEGGEVDESASISDADGKSERPRLRALDGGGDSRPLPGGDSVA